MAYLTKVTIVLTGLVVYCFADTCVDKLPDCADYTRSSCQGPYVSWAYENCRAFCGFCHQECVNKRNDCHEYGAEMCHAPYETWAKENCAKYCGFCGPEIKCLYTPWVDESPCSRTCGGGLKVQVRAFTLVPSGTPLAKDCNNTVNKLTTCNIKPCPTSPSTTRSTTVTPLSSTVKVTVPVTSLAIATTKAPVKDPLPDVVPEIVPAVAAGVAGAAAGAAIETGLAALAETALVSVFEFLPALAFLGKRDINDESKAFEDIIRSVLEMQNLS